jgi:glyoxylase-like metal-dependent hydrolase (beta-lactamase superfamily II)
MRLTRDVALVGGGSTFGFGLTSGSDAHCYLLDGGDSAALIDCGMGSPESLNLLLDNVLAAGTRPDSIRHLALTHYHADHCAGAKRYRDHLGLQVLAGHETAEALEAGNHASTSYAAALARGVFPSDVPFPPCPVDVRLSDGEVFRVGRLTVRYLSTPGHCAGHGAYLVTGGERIYLFTGDALFAGGQMLLQATWDCDLQASLATIRVFAELTFDSLLPGHGALALSGGMDHVAAAMATIESLGVPKNLA